MDYELTLPKSEIAIPILLVADVMAKYKATLGGTATYHNNTYKASYKSLCLTLLDEVRHKRLNICDNYGIEIQNESVTDELHNYFSTLEQLNSWGKGTHVFTRVDMNIKVFTLDRSDEKGNIQKDFHRGFIWGSISLTNNDTITKPLLQQTFQEQEILRVILELGFTPTKLPANIIGKKGVKSAVRKKIPTNVFSVSVFNKAWERLLENNEIQYE